MHYPCTVSSFELMSNKCFFAKFIKSVSTNLDTIFDLSVHKGLDPAPNFLLKSRLCLIILNYIKILGKILLRFLPKLPKYDANCQYPRLLCHCNDTAE